MNLEKLIERITEDDLENDMKFLATFLDMITIRKIILYAGGTSCYFTQPDYYKTKILQRDVEKRIKSGEKLSNMDAKLLAKEYGLSKLIVSRKIKEVSSSN